jgi:hypothetical protein
MANVTRKEYNRAIAEWTKFPRSEKLNKIIKFVERSFLDNTPLYFPVGDTEDVNNMELGSYRLFYLFYDDGGPFFSFVDAIHLTPNDWILRLNDGKFHGRDSEGISYFSGFLKVKDTKVKEEEMYKAKLL